MKIAVLTSRLLSPEVAALCQTLSDAGIAVSEIVSARNPAESRLQHWGANNRLVRRIIGRMGRGDFEPCERTSEKIKERGIARRFFTQPFHSPKVLAHLHRLQPDLLINFRGPIYRKATIATARLGVINCHMALLPEFRGMNVAEWSVLHGYPTGNTIHFIDEGIDTGDILAFFPAPVADCRTIEQMRGKLIARHHEHVARAVRLFLADRIHPTLHRREHGRQYFTMHPTLKEKVGRILALGYEPAISVSERSYVFIDRECFP